MKKTQKKSAIIISIILSVTLFCSCTFVEYPEYPETGKWKSEELDIVLDFDTGLGLWIYNGEEIVLDISTGPNTSIFSLCVSRKNSDTCSMEDYTVIFFGYYQGIEGNKLSIREKETKHLYWFSLIESTGDGLHESGRKV